MAGFSFEQLDLPDLFLIEPFFIEDERGYFSKNYEKDIFREAGILTDIQEEFESLSHRGVLRGIHFQTECPQSKIIKVLRGEIYDIAVDLRKDSSTYKQWRGVYLNEKNRKSFFIPQGFGHGFLTLSEKALVTYKCTGKYCKEKDTGVFWMDPDLGIQWPVDKVDEIRVSKRDQGLPSFKEYDYGENNAGL